VISQDKNPKTEEDSASADITPNEPITSGANPSIPGTPLPSSDHTASSIICTPVPTESPSSQVTLLAVGDNLIHIEVVESGEQEDGSLNYDHLYSNLKDEISAADIAVVNQETILGGDDFKYSGYPAFNSPTEIGDALIAAGFDVVLQATNHTMDMGEKGIDHAIAYWKEHPGIVTLGINESQEDSEAITIIEKNGIKIAMLNYTYSLNGYSLPDDKPYLVNMLDKDKMEQDIRKAEEMADFTIVFPHWGTEYVYTATSSQEDLTSFYYDLGVDLVIGSHPHVLEPVEWIETEKGHKMLVYYSLGNFLSYQKEAPRMLGGMAFVTITKDESGTYISDADITPIVTHYEHGPADYNYGIYKLSDYSEALASVHGVSDIAQQGSLTYQKTVDLAKKVLGSWYQ
jgi:poly-gamma-glutamate synthesis protein (capsule biosynthesis protein)